MKGLPYIAISTPALVLKGISVQHLGLSPTPVASLLGILKKRRASI